MSFSSNNEKCCACFINKLASFPSEKVKFNVFWNTSKIQSLFPLKGKVWDLSCAIYNGICSCGERYVGEIIRHFKIRWDEHNDVNKNFEPAKHLARKIEHEFSWYVLAGAPVEITKALLKS